MLCLCIAATVEIARALQCMLFLRLVHETDHAIALWHVSQRVDQEGYPLFDIARQSNELMQWVESNLGAALDAESGICCWQHCNG